jgi:hypothetical protein
MNTQMREYASALTYKFNSFTFLANTGGLLLNANPQRHSIIWGPYNGSPWYVSNVPITALPVPAFFLGNTLTTTWSITLEGMMVTNQWYGYAFTNAGYLMVVEGLVIP